MVIPVPVSEASNKYTHLFLGFGPAHIEKLHFKGIFGCIFRQSLMKYGGNKSIKENSLRRGF
jgi:hypothetical protein